VIEQRLALRSPLDLVATLAPLRHGRGDRTIQLARGTAWLATWMADGPATMHVRHDGDATVAIRAWGDGAANLVASLPDLLGEHDEPARLVAQHPVVRDLQRRHGGLRLPRTGRVFAALLPTIVEQKVTGTKAFRAYAVLLRAHGAPAPGPGDLLLPPRPETLSGLPYHAYHRFGLERRRADVIRHAASRAAWLESAPGSAEAHRRMMSLPGIGPWTAAEVVRVAFGDPDAVSIGDYHVPNMVAWALAGEPRANDARMLELLEPYRGQRGRVQRLLEVGRVMAPRYGPRMAPRHIAEI